MIVRTDHIAGGAAIAIGVAVFAISGDLPFGTLRSPSAGMLPKLLCGLMVICGLVLVIGGGQSKAVSRKQWGNLPHALPVFAVATVAVALYTTLGFIVSMAAMLFALALLERRPVLHAAAFGVCVSLVTYALFTYGLKAPLERGVFGF